MCRRRGVRRPVSGRKAPSSGESSLPPVDDLAGAVAADFSEGDWFIMDGLVCRWSDTWGPVTPEMYAAPGTGYNPGSGATAHKWNIQHRWRARDIDPDTEVTGTDINTLTANVGNVGGALSGPAGNEAQYAATSDPLGGPAIQVTAGSSQELQLASTECFDGLAGSLIYVFGKPTALPGTTSCQLVFVSQGDVNSQYRASLSFSNSRTVKGAGGSADADAAASMATRTNNPIANSPYAWGGFAALVDCAKDLGSLYHSEIGFDESGQYNQSAAYSATNSLLIRIGGGPGGFMSFLYTDILLIGAPHNTHDNVVLLDRLHRARYGLLGA